MKRIALGLALVVLVAGCHHHRHDADGLDDAVEGLINWAQPENASDGESDNLATVKQNLEYIHKYLIEMKRLCEHLEALAASGQFPEFGSFQCVFPGPGAGGDSPPTGKPPEWP